MNKQNSRVPLIVATVCILCIDLANVIDLLNMGSTGNSTLVNVCFLLANLLLAAGWGFYFLKKPAGKENA